MLPAGRLDRLVVESISLARAPISILSVKPVWLLIPNEHFPYKKTTSQLLLSATCLSSNSLRLSTIRSSWESMLDVCLLAAKKGDKRRRKGGNWRTGFRISAKCCSGRKFQDIFSPCHLEICFSILVHWRAANASHPSTRQPSHGLQLAASNNIQIWRNHTKTIPSMCRW